MKSSATETFLSLAMNINRVRVCAIANRRIPLLWRLVKATYIGMYHDVILRFPPYERSNPTHLFPPKKLLPLQDYINLVVAAEQVPFHVRLWWSMHQSRR